MTNGFDWATFDPDEFANREFTCVPAGRYPAIITSIEAFENKAATGHYLLVRVELIREHKGRVIFDRLNVVHPNEDTVLYAKRSYASIMHALGLKKGAQPQDFLNKPLEVTVTVKPWNGEERSEIKAYRPLKSAPPAASPSAPPAAPKLEPVGTGRTVPLADDEIPF